MTVWYLVLWSWSYFSLPLLIPSTPLLHPQSDCDPSRRPPASNEYTFWKGRYSGWLDATGRRRLHQTRRLGHELYRFCLFQASTQLKTPRLLSSYWLSLTLGFAIALSWSFSCQHNQQVVPSPLLKPSRTYQHRKHSSKNLFSGFCTIRPQLLPSIFELYRGASFLP